MLLYGELGLVQTREHDEVRGVKDITNGKIQVGGSVQERLQRQECDSIHTGS
jgi:hypothetical protein